MSIISEQSQIENQIKASQIVVFYNLPVEFFPSLLLCTLKIELHIFMSYFKLLSSLIESRNYYLRCPFSPTHH